MKSFVMAAVVASTVVGNGALAQSTNNDLKAERAQNLSYWYVDMVKFKPGKRQRASELVEQYFRPIDQEMGGQSIDIHMGTGEWDYITLFPMPGGPVDLTWLTSPDDVRFMNLLAKRAGSMEAARKIVDEWESLVARQEDHIAHTHN
jgi:hypothetical protein